MHTRGEWTIPEPFEGQGKVFVWSDDGDANGEDPVAMCDGPDREANAARIVAMHAACAGIETSRLTPGLVADLRDALKACAAVCAGDTLNKIRLIDALTLARAVLAKLEDR